MLPSYLSSACSAKGYNGGNGYCACAGCAEAVKQNPATGRWYVTMGHPGFNSRMNNGLGYVSEASARKAYDKYRSGRY